MALCFCSTFSAKAAYNGTPVTPNKINSRNYATYGFNSTNYSAYEGWYGIRNAAELYGFAALVNGGTNTANGVLTADIEVNRNVLELDGTLNGTPTYSWTPIGILENEMHRIGFVGNFDGQGHTISGLYFDNTTSGNYPLGGSYVGLFGFAGTNESNSSGRKVTIKNVGVVDSYFRGCSFVGGICGACDGWGGSVDVSNCYNTATVIAYGTIGAGGICGVVSGTYQIRVTNCYNTIR